MNGTYKENRMNSQRPAARRQTVNMRNVYVASFFAAAALLLVLSMFLFFNVSEIKIEGFCYLCCYYFLHIATLYCL